MGSSDGAPVPSDVWIDERVIVGPSDIDGRGLFAAADIDEGTVLVRLGGRIVTTGELEDLMADARRDPAASYIDTLTIEDGIHLVLPSESRAHFGNHSCDPTLWHDGAFELAARRNVSRGTELTIDYGTNSGAPGFAMRCHCGAPECRGEVTSDDWKRTELRRRYGAHWTPALLERIRGDGVA
jgi:hypothetical protein